MSGERARELGREIVRRARELEDLRRQFSQIQTDCPHEWGNTEYVPDRIPAHTEGDPPGTMGVDRIPEFRVPEKVIHRWRRTCTLCGYKQETNKEREEKTVKLSPDFGR